MTTVSTDRLYATLVRDALAFVPPGGVALSATLGHRMYRQAAPRDAAYPYAVFSLRSTRIADGNNSLKVLYDFEGFVWNRPRSTQPATERLADTWATYLRTLLNISNGLMYATDVTAESLPLMSTPADANVVQVLVRARLQVWPTLISSLSA